METKTLYSLSKDELVLLISTIQEDLQKELTTYKDIVKTFNDKSSFCQLEKCSGLGCNRFWLFEEGDYDEGVDYCNDGKLYFCSCMEDGCDCNKNADKGIGWWCFEHLPPTDFKYTNGHHYICQKCVEH